MALPKISDIWNSTKLRGQLAEAHAKADAAMAGAKIVTLVINGATVAAVDAPLENKIAALAAQIATGSASKETSEQIANNAELAERLEESQSALALANTANATLTQKNSQLQNELNVANAGIQRLTAEGAQNVALLTASNKEVSRLSSVLTTQKTELANRCLAANCLDLKGDDGKPLVEEATAEQKLSAAMKVSHDDLFKAYNGAVNAAIKKTGTTFANIPNPAPSEPGPKKTEAKGRDRFTQAVKIVR